MTDIDLKCKHCGRAIGDGDERRGWCHRDDYGYTSKSRCDPDESGLPYGYNAEPEGHPCSLPCAGVGVSGGTRGKETPL